MKNSFHLAKIPSHRDWSVTTEHFNWIPTHSLTVKIAELMWDPIETIAFRSNGRHDFWPLSYLDIKSTQIDKWIHVSSGVGETPSPSMLFVFGREKSAILLDDLLLHQNRSHDFIFSRSAYN